MREKFSTDEEINQVKDVEVTLDSATILLPSVPPEGLLPFKAEIKLI